MNGGVSVRLKKMNRESIVIDWRALIGFALIIGLVALSWLLGPVIIVAFLLQRWAAREIWSARDRWASLSGFAWSLGILTVLLCLCTLRTIPIASPALATLWSHIPTIWNVSLRQAVIRWSIALPCAPCLAILLEIISPRTIWTPHRTLLATELASLQRKEEQKGADLQAEKEQKHAAELAQHTSQALPPKPIPEPIPAPQPKKAPRARKKKTTEASVQTPPSASPDLPQETLWIPVEQATSPQPEEAPTLPQPSPQPTYDWNQGEGSLKDL
jgi:outer membrane biosynthesis protein TonB